MNNTASTRSILDKAVVILGTSMMLVWTLGIGIVGFIVLLAIPWALATQSHNLAIVSSFLVIVPLMLTLLWGLLMLVGVIRDKVAAQLSDSSRSRLEEYQIQRARISYMPNLL